MTPPKNRSTGKLVPLSAKAQAQAVLEAKQAEEAEAAGVKRLQDEAEAKTAEVQALRDAVEHQPKQAPKSAPPVVLADEITLSITAKRLRGRSLVITLSPAEEDD